MSSPLFFAMVDIVPVTFFRSKDVPDADETYMTFVSVK